MTKQDRAEQPFDPVERPKHYNSDPSGIECIELARYFPFSLGNALKYLWRAGLKETEALTKDLKKAAWYLRDAESHASDHGPVQSLDETDEKELVNKLLAVTAHREQWMADVLGYLVEAIIGDTARVRVLAMRLALMIVEKQIAEDEALQELATVLDAAVSEEHSAPEAPDLPSEPLGVLDDRLWYPESAESAPESVSTERERTELDPCIELLPKLLLGYWHEGAPPAFHPGRTHWLSSGDPCAALLSIGEYALSLVKIDGVWRVQSVPSADAYMHSKYWTPSFESIQSNQVFVTYQGSDMDSVRRRAAYSACAPPDAEDRELIVLYQALSSPTGLDADKARARMREIEMLRKHRAGPDRERRFRITGIQAITPGALTMSFGVDAARCARGDQDSILLSIQEAVPNV